MGRGVSVVVNHVVSSLRELLKIRVRSAEMARRSVTTATTTSSGRMGKNARNSAREFATLATRSEIFFCSGPIVSVGERETLATS